MFTKQERIQVGKSIYLREKTYKEAQEEYGVARVTLITWVNLYKESVGAPKGYRPTEMMINKYDNLSKIDLIKELLTKDIEIERLKKGYQVKGVGAKKEYVTLKGQNTK
ncbi:MAG: hypothetical protein Q4F12_04900 [Erysipelotrichaceae bacterium]|nr:hypothetical protein [Erysipelotrichaceae bacterium]